MSWNKDNKPRIRPGRILVAIAVSVVSLEVPAAAIPLSFANEGADHALDWQPWSIPEPDMTNKGVTKMLVATGWLPTWELAESLNGSTPAVGISVDVTNPLASTQTFEFTASAVSADEVAAPSLMRGSLSINLMDNVLLGDPGAELAAPAGETVYEAEINGTSVTTIPALAHPFTLTAPPNGTNSAGPFDFSDPNGPAVSVGDTLTIRIRFTLTGYDTAQIVATFFLPEPSAFLLTVPGGLILLQRRRQR